MRNSGDRHIVTRLAADRVSAFALLALTALLAVVALSVSVGVGGPGLEGFVLRWLLSGVIIAAGMLTMARAARAPRERVAWLLIGLGVVLWGVGLEYWELVLATSDSPPYPSVSDAFWPAFYPLCYVGLALLLHSRLGRSAPASGWTA